MAEEISRYLKKIGTELENVSNALTSIWYSRYENGETDVLDPRCHADEYITVEDCAKRLHVTPQTIRNWIKIGMHNEGKGWKAGIHYVNVAGDAKLKGYLRIPWNSLVQTFAKNPIEHAILHKNVLARQLYRDIVHPDDVADHPKL
jgi:hypothetical protein